MKALVISDSHGAEENLRELMALAEREIRPDALIFCGDGLSDVLPCHRAAESFWPVKGNCDLCPPPGTPQERTERLGSLWVYVTHGHAQRVKHGLLSLRYRAEEVGARVACFGHTHASLAQWEGGVLLLNPGALCHGRYAVLEVFAQGEVKAELKVLKSITL